MFINKTGRKIDRIAIEIPDNVWSEFILSCAPEINCSDGILAQEGFQKYVKSKIGCSSLGIKMDLLKRNKAEIIENLAMLIDDEKEAKEVCHQLRHGSLCERDMNSVY